MSRRRVEQLVQIRDRHLAAVALASCEAADARAPATGCCAAARAAEQGGGAGGRERGDRRAAARRLPRRGGRGGEQQLQDADARLQRNVKARRSARTEAGRQGARAVEAVARADPRGGASGYGVDNLGRVLFLIRQRLV